MQWALRAPPPPPPPHGRSLSTAEAGQRELFGIEPKIEQRGAQTDNGDQKQKAERKREIKKVKVQAMTATQGFPAATPVAVRADIKVNVVRISESGNVVSKRPLEWILITKEPIHTFDQIAAINKAYEMRWKIEEFRKAWKTGCRVEENPLKTFQAEKR